MTEVTEAQPAIDDEVDLDALGPVDWIVVEFPGSRFKGEIAPVLNDLVERDLVRVLDLLVLKKEADGTLQPFELSDLDESEIGGLRSYETELAMLLIGGPGVIGPAPVARAAGTVATVAVVSHGVNRRQDRRDDRRDRR